MPHQFEMVRAVIVEVVMAEIVAGHIPEILAAEILIPAGLVCPTVIASLAAVAGRSFMAAAAGIAAGGSGAAGSGHRTPHALRLADLHQCERRPLFYRGTGPVKH